MCRDQISKDPARLNWLYGKLEEYESNAEKENTLWGRARILIDAPVSPYAKLKLRLNVSVMTHEDVKEGEKPIENEKWMRMLCS